MYHKKNFMDIFQTREMVLILDLGVIELEPVCCKKKHKKVPEQLLV